MKTLVYSFYSNRVSAFAQVKASSKKHVVIYAREIMKENISVSDIRILRATKNSHQASIEMLYPDLLY